MTSHERWNHLHLLKSKTESTVRILELVKHNMFIKYSIYANLLEISVWYFIWILPYRTHVALLCQIYIIIKLHDYNYDSWDEFALKLYLVIYHGNWWANDKSPVVSLASYRRSFDHANQARPDSNLVPSIDLETLTQSLALSAETQLFIKHAERRKITLALLQRPYIH